MITLLTDFGLSDYFVPAVKGVILSIHPEAQIVDITHDAPAQDVHSAAFLLGACYRDFPAGTIHVVVVDPGVGSARRAIIVDAGGFRFVGPDNGVFSFVYEREPSVRVFRITNDQFFRHPVSPTFHGRDVFAPVAARLHGGVDPPRFGPEIEDYIRFEIPRPRRPEPEATALSAPPKLIGALLHIDRFGNCVTNFTQSELRLDQATPRTRFYLRGREVRQFGAFFAEADDREELFAYPGSAGFWEVALWRGSAANSVNARRGDEVILDCGL
jgi:S-adenosylmethionine hydrolase